MKALTGFTLIELLVTIVLTAILVGVAAPSLSRSYDHYRAQTSIDTFRQYLAAARNQAISYGSRITVCPLKSTRCVNDWSLGLTMFIDRGASNELDGDDRIIQESSPFNSKDTATYSRRAIRFLPTGLASGTNGTFRYCPSAPDSAESMALVVNNAGRTRIREDAITCQ